MGDLLVKKRPTTCVDKVNLPEIVGPFRLENEIEKNEELRKNTLINAALMKNWSDKQSDNNQVDKKL